MYLSKITLQTSALSPGELLQLVERGEYVMHQWLWTLFPGAAKRCYLYRREELQGAFCFYVLSQEAPHARPPFTLETRPFSPALTSGQRLRFNLRANPVVCKSGKRHDLLMEAKHHWRGKAEKSEIRGYQEQAVRDWLLRQGEQNGFALVDVETDAYRQQQLRKDGQPIRFSSVDLTGVLIVTDPDAFLTRLAQGFGKSRAFGCGLMLIKPDAGQ
ncbi:type I-E CRISPR-associated protein Cas6/Cse3/CasE [Enterobacter sp.]|uniref:type I-E CRISPR-associated protein Cas6/Cse3/CasE n=1 Tax=Enterobacter sp. TaxID=42895 RepID=UPI00296F48B9|nr:type I-E CRISPR-associated protein Cas6/Cse3/CasE [Enterobacter sp.]